MNIRTRQQDDIAECVSLLATVHAADGYPLIWPPDPAAWLMPANQLCAWVAQDDVDIIGHVALCSAVGDAAASLWSTASGLSPEHLGVVAKLFVAPSARGCGVGASLLAHVCAEAHILGLHPALEVLAHDQSAIALYERAGWYHVASVPAPWTRTSTGQAMLLHYYLASE